jgi:hypothetical protein
MDNMKTTVAALAGISVILLVMVQFMPWGTWNQSGVEVEANSWNVEVESDFLGFEGSDSHGWYDDEADNEEGVSQVRIAIPFLVAGSVAALLGAVLSFAVRGPAGPFAILTAALLLIVATVLYIQGINAFFGENDADHEWAASFYMAITACALLTVAGVLGLVAGNRARSA